MNSKLLLCALIVLSAACINVSAQNYAITNAKVVTVSGSLIENGTIIIRDGLIENVGSGIKVPADVTIIDVSGSTVYPGFIDSLSNLGMPAPQAQQRGRGAAAAFAAAAAAAQAPPDSNSNYPDGLRPERSAEDDLRGGNAQFESARNAGFTTALTVGRTGLFNGRSAVIDLAGDTVSAMVVRSPFAEHITFTTVGGGNYPGSLLGTFAALRQMMYDAKRLAELQKMYAADPKSMKRPEAERSLEALIPVVNGQMPVVFNANREIEIIRALDLIKEFNLKGIIGGGQEAWKLTDRLKAAKIPVLLSLNFPRRTTTIAPDADPESLDTLRFRAETPGGAAKLAASGVRFAFQTGGAASMNDVFSNAGKAVEAGLSRDAAIRALTLSGAEILGVDDRLGSIEKGKIANLVIIKGDLFGRDRFTKYVFVDGVMFEQKEPSRSPTRGPGDPGIRPLNPNVSVPQIGGVYTITIDAPGMPLPATLNITQANDTFTGTLVSQLGTAQIKDGRINTEGFAFSTTVQYEGQPLDISVKGKVADNAVSGTMESVQGTIPFAGTKNP